MANTYVVNLSFPRGAPAPEEREAQHRFLAELLDEGMLLLAGRFPDDGGGGMAILEAASEEEARARYEQAPFVASGRADWELREWDVTWGETR